jgi:hypothetical protein
VQTPAHDHASHDHTSHQQPTKSTGNIVYQYDWQWGKAVPQTDGVGWGVTNDLGYRIRIQRGYITTANTELMACAHTHASANDTSIVAALLGLRVAHAGHGGQNDPSKLTQPQVESLTSPKTNVVIAVWGDEPTYCNVHYLIGYANESANNLPNEVNLVGTSLYLEGEYTAPGSDKLIAFKLQSPLAWGEAKALADPASGIDEKSGVKTGSNLHLIISRELGSMFDSLDFVHMNEQEQAKTVLRNLIAHTQVVLHCK